MALNIRVRGKFTIVEWFIQVFVPLNIRNVTIFKKCTI